MLGKKKVTHLDDTGVLRLRQQALAGTLNVREAAQVYGVSPESIRRAVRGDTFGHLGQVSLMSDEQAARGADASLKRVQEMLAKENEGKNRANALLEELDDPSKGEL